MNQASLALSMLLVILVAEHQGDRFGPPPSVATEDSIKAAHEKFDLEMKLDTKRPWDGITLTGPHALERRRNPPI